MKFRNYLSTGLCLAALASLTSCFDNDYDLSDIDTTAKVVVNDLVIPVDFKELTLDKIMDISDDSQIKKIIDPATGKEIYAVLEDGEFESEDIDIPSFTTVKPDITPIISNLDLEPIRTDLYTQLDAKIEERVKEEVDKYMAQYSQYEGTPVYDQYKKEATEYAQKEAEKNRESYKKQVFNDVDPNIDLARYEITTDSTEVLAESHDVDKSLRAIDNVDVKADFRVDITLNNLTDMLDNIPARNFRIQMPKNLTITNCEGAYDPKTGVLDFSKTNPMIKKGKYSFSFSITNVDAKNNSEITFIPENNKQGYFKLLSNIHVMPGCYVYVQKGNFINGHTFFDLPDEADFTCKPDMSEVNVESFTGKIAYNVDAVDIDPIELTDLPDILTDKETNIILDNPQIYISIENPLAENNLRAETNISITKERSGVKEANPITVDEKIVASSNNNDYCFSPVKPEKFYTGFNNSKWQKFSRLGEVIAGKGVPDKLYVDVINPCIPEQPVTKFKLGQNIGKVNGKYTFYAPLLLKNADEKNVTKIIYNETMDGWSDETLEKLTITNLVLDIASLDSELPLNAVLSIKPLDANGNKIAGVDFTTAEIKANTKAQHVILKQTAGTIKNLDGISINATITTDGKQSLAPEQTIKLNKVKVTVSGYYEDEL